MDFFSTKYDVAEKLELNLLFSLKLGTFYIKCDSKRYFFFVSRKYSFNLSIIQSEIARLADFLDVVLLKI